MTQARETKKKSDELLDHRRGEEHQHDSEFQTHSLLHLQRRAGNRAVVGLLDSYTQLQTKLRSDLPGDAYEQEADDAAKQFLQLTSAPVGVIQRKCATCSPTSTCASCEEEERVQRKPKAIGSAPSLQVQRSSRNGDSAGSAAQDTAEPEATATGPLIVEDDAATVAPGQMRKSEFLEQLRGTVCTTADEALKEAGQSTEGCPYIEKWLGYYEDRPPAHIERALRKYAPEAVTATNARDYIPAVSNRVRRAVATWAKTGELTGVPDELKDMLTGPGAALGAVAGALGSIGSAIGGAVSAVAGAIGGAFSSIGKALFKRKEGQAQETDNPQEIQQQLRGGQPLDGGAMSRMGAAFGHDFSGVRVHTDSGAAGLSDRLNARAFTVGGDIAFSAGEYRPGTLIGDALIAHELAHVVQQRGEAAEVNPKGEESGSESLEQEADDVAVGAVTSLWGERVDALKRTGRAAIPHLKSGLKLQRCSKEKYDFELYRVQFNRLWTNAAFNTLPVAFDATLSSKGPRTTRARKIFERIYADDPALRKAYDGNHSGVRERIDTYIGPEGLDIVIGAGGKTVTESPRLQALVKVFRGFDPPVSPKKFPGFIAAIKKAAAALDDGERRAVENSNEWQRFITDYGKTDEQRNEIKLMIKTPPPSPKTQKPPKPPAPPPASADVAQNFVNNVTINGPTSAVEATGREEEVKLTPHSTTPNPSVDISTQFTLTPADRVKDKGNVSKASPWPSGAQDGVPFKPKIINTSDVTMNAHLDLVGGADAPKPAAPIDFQFEVKDKRLEFFLKSWQMHLIFNGGGWLSGTTSLPSPPLSTPVSYRGGAQQFTVAGFIVKLKWTNPGLDIFLKASIRRGTTTVFPFAKPAPWPPDRRDGPQIYMPVSAPANVPKTGDPLTFRLEVIGADNKVIDFKETTINVFAEVRYTKAEAEAAAAEDDAFFRSDDPKKGLRGIMTNPAELQKVSSRTQPQLAANVVEAIRSGRIKFSPLTRRHDSANFVTAKNRGKPDPDKAAYFAGPRYKLGHDDPNSFVAETNAAGFSRKPGDIVAERTVDVNTNQKRDTGELIMIVVHEGVHAFDIQSGGEAPFERYKKEFRAYWMEGSHGPPETGACPSPIGCKETAYDPLLPPPGPKSARARAIFEHMYQPSGPYKYVKQNYDNNTDGFRRAVDNYLIPDGINLIVSVRLHELYRVIEGWNGRRFTQLHDDVQAAVAKLDQNDRNEIVRNRAWRDLVERKVDHSALQAIIKSRLGIPK